MPHSVHSLGEFLYKLMLLNLAVCYLLFRYRRNAKEMSRIYRDQPQTPLERAVFWVEYVIRHKGAHHMRSTARDLNLIQYYCLDVISVMAGVVALVLYILFAITRKVLAVLCGWRKGEEGQIKKKQ